MSRDFHEGLFLADRVMLMTNGPAAEVGDILTVPFPRPRHRARLLEDSSYYECREHLIDFLENRAHLRPGTAAHAA